MKRTTKITLEDCYSCPFFICHDGYASHYYTCYKLDISSSLVDDVEKYGIVALELSDWFENKCNLEVES